MLNPIFDNVPVALKERPHWVAWKGAKVPFCATAINRKASVTDPDTWASFDQAQAAYLEGGYDGIGYVLNGDGIAGIDLDKCVSGGAPEPNAMEILRRVGCSYIELSPSGSGLRGFGYAPSAKGKRGQINGVATELYTRERFLTVTGHAIENGPVAELKGFENLWSSVDSAAPNRRVQKKQQSSSGSSVSSVSSLPTGDGQRNAALFEFARKLKAERPEASREELRELVASWHREAYPLIGTKDFATTWGDFWRGWQAVKYPFGETLQRILVGIDHAAPLPVFVTSLGYSETAIRLYRICLALQSHQGDQPFFISARQAGELIGLNHVDASRQLSAFVADGLVELISRGAGKVASRYRMTHRNGAQHG